MRLLYYNIHYNSYRGVSSTFDVLRVLSCTDLIHHFVSYHRGEDSFHGRWADVGQDIAYLLFGNRQEAVQYGRFYPLPFVHFFRVYHGEPLIKLLVAIKQSTGSHA